jgi:hypothetical protein
MKVKSPITFLRLALTLSPLLLWHCDLDPVSSADQPLVEYTLLVADSASGLPLDSVRIETTTVLGDTASFYTDSLSGRSRLPALASSRTLFLLSRHDYKTMDWLDTVASPPDTVYHRPLQRVLRLKMAPVVLP